MFLSQKWPLTTIPLTYSWNVFWLGIMSHNMSYPKHIFQVQIDRWQYFHFQFVLNNIICQRIWVSELPEAVQKDLLRWAKLKDFFSDITGNLFNLLHLFSDSCPCCLVSAFSLSEIIFNISNQCFKIFVFLHFFPYQYENYYWGRRLPSEMGIVKAKLSFTLQSHTYSIDLLYHKQLNHRTVHTTFQTCP